jgi:putative inorganic carbon (HCO3(-)) transporter
MLRSIFVILLIIVGIGASLNGPIFGLLFYLWIAYFRPESWMWDSFLQNSNLSMYVGVYLIAISIFARKRLVPHWRTALLGLILLQCLLSTLFSNYFSYCWPQWIQFAKVIIITFLITVLVTSVRELKWVIWVIALSLGFEGAKQGWAQLILNPGAYNQNTNPFLGDNNGTAIGMLMLVPLLLSLVHASKSKWPRFGYRFLAIGVAYRALTTYSRGGLLAFVAMFGIYWVRSRHKVLTLCVTLALAGMILPVFPDAFWQRMKTITTSQEEMDSSSAGRVYFWNVGIKMANNHPLLGVGHGGFRAAYDSYDLSNGRYGPARSIHSMWFGILAETGYTGLALFLILFIVSWRSCVYARKLCGNDISKAFVKGCATAVETGLITAAVGGTFLSFQYIEMLWHFFGLSIAIQQIASSQSSNAEAKHMSPTQEEHPDEVDGQMLLDNSIQQMVTARN